MRNLIIFPVLGLLSLSALGGSGTVMPAVGTDTSLGIQIGTQVKFAEKGGFKYCEGTLINVDDRGRAHIEAHNSFRLKKIPAQNVYVSHKTGFSMPLRSDQQHPLVTAENLGLIDAGLLSDAIVVEVGERALENTAPPYFFEHTKRMSDAELAGEHWLYLGGNESPINSLMQVTLVGVIDHPIKTVDFGSGHRITKIDSRVVRMISGSDSFSKNVLIDADRSRIFRRDRDAKYGMFSVGDRVTFGNEFKVDTVIGISLISAELLVQSGDRVFKMHINSAKRVLPTHPTPGSLEPGAKVKDRDGNIYTFLFYYVDQANRITNARVSYTDPCKPTSVWGYTFKPHELEAAPL